MSNINNNNSNSNNKQNSSLNIYSKQLHHMFKFNSSHFIVHDTLRELLHGHNYKISIKINSYNLTDNKEIVDNEVLMKEAKSICSKLHGKLMLSYDNPNCITKYITNDDEIIENSKEFIIGKMTGKNNLKSVILTCKNDDTEFKFPYIDCIFLDIPQVSAENLALYIVDNLLSKKDLFLFNEVKYKSIEVLVYEDLAKMAIIEKNFE